MAKQKLEGADRAMMMAVFSGIAFYGAWTRGSFAVDSSPVKSPETLAKTCVDYGRAMVDALEAEAQGDDAGG